MKSLLIIFISIPTFMAIICSTGYFDNNGSCSFCGIYLSACQTCTNKTSCTSCLNYGILTSGTCKLCYTLIPDCYTCSSTTVCTKCDSFFRVNSSNLCERCDDIECLNCSIGINQCSNCYQGHGVEKSNNTCRQCQIQHCRYCSNDSQLCTQCENNYGFDQNKTVCLQCQQTNCDDCASNISKYYDCKSGYGFGILHETCIKCSSFCVYCYSNYTKCTNCLNGYGLGEQPSTTNIICLPCSSNCKYCFVNSSVCTSCQSYYRLNTIDKTCQPCSTNCTSCLINGSCVSCLNGYGYTSGNNCLKCSSGCSLCQLDYSSCTYCDDGFGLSTIGGYYCILCSSLCKTCSRSGAYFQSTSCQDGFYLRDSQCKACPKFNLKCKWTSPYIICLQPQPGTMKYFDGYIDRCGQACGDSVTENYACDNDLGVPYDGCDDNCQVMDDFQCIVTNDTNGINGTTQCQYTGNIVFKLVSFQRFQEGNNFTMIIEIVEPIIHSFLSLTSEKAAQMFMIKNSLFNITGVKYDKVKNLITFEADFSEDLMDMKRFNISFHQSFVEDQQFMVPFQYDNLNQPIFLTETYFMFCKVVLYGSYFVVVLGWISFMIGILVRKLYGIEVIMMVQICWISLMWNETRYFMFIFSKTWPLRLSSGYNMLLFKEGSDVTELSNYLYVGIFEMLNKLFINNLNLSLCFVILPSVFVLVFYYKFRIRRSNKSAVKYGTFDGEKDNKLMNCEKHLTRCCQILMQGCMVIVPYYFQCLVIFLKYGELRNIGSVLLLTLCGIIIICTLISFIWHPTLFEYFRLSFVVQLFALNYWFIHVFVIIATVLIITVLPAITYLALIPSFFMLIFIPIVRPYQQSKHNVTACLNYFVILCFLLLRIGQTYLPSETKSEQNVFMFYLLFLICGLLPLIICINNAAMIYDYFMQRFFIKIQNAVKNQLKQKMEQRKLLSEISTIYVHKSLKHSNANLLKSVLPGKETVLNYSNALNYYLIQSQRQMNLNQQAKKTLENLGVYGNSEENQEKVKKYQRIKKQIKSQIMINKNRNKNRKDEELSRDNDQQERLQWHYLNFETNEQNFSMVIDASQQKQIPNEDNDKPSLSLQGKTSKILMEENKFINLKGAFQKSVNKVTDNNNNKFVQIYDLM